MTSDSKLLHFPVVTVFSSIFSTDDKSYASLVLLDSSTQPTWLCLLVSWYLTCSVQYCMYTYMFCFLYKTPQGEFGLEFICAIMEESILLLDIGILLAHASILIHKGPKGRTSILCSLKGIDWVSVIGHYGTFLCLVIDLCTFVPEYSMGMGGYNDKISFNGLGLCVIWLSSSESRAVNWHIHRLSNNIGRGKLLTPMQQ